MEWEEYIQEVLSEESCLNDIKFTFDGRGFDIPDIIKASVYLLEKMLKNQGRCNLFIFPEGKITPFVFMLSKLIYNFWVGKIEASYEAIKFQPGQKLKFGNSISEFIKIDYDSRLKEDAIYLKFSDCIYRCKIQNAPYFQTIDTKRPLSNSSKFNQEKLKIEKDEQEHNSVINLLYDMKTHMTESLMYISSLSRSMEFLKELKIDNKEISDYFFVSQTDYSGKLQTVKGLYYGTPALILSGNIAYANESIRKGARIQSVVINLVDNDINSQLAELDELIGQKFPVLCVTDTSHSFDLGELQGRGFNIWRWDGNSITSRMCKEGNCINQKSACCKYQRIDYREIQDKVISKAFLKLYSYRNRIEKESATLNLIYNKLFQLFCSFLRRIVTYNDIEKKNIFDCIAECEYLIEREKVFVDETTLNDFSFIIDSAKDIVENNMVLQKIQMIEATIVASKSNDVCILCSNNDDVFRIKEDWEKRLSSHGMEASLIVMSIRDYLKNPPEKKYEVFLTSWFGSKTIKLVLYGYYSSRIHIFLYKCENRWKKAHTRFWKKNLNSSGNRDIVQKSFIRNKDRSDIVLQFNDDNDMSSDTDNEIINEQDDMEIVVQENKYRQYISNARRSGGTETEACPISFAGGEFALFTRGHKSIVVTKIIHQLSNKIEVKETQELQVGDFIVIRESSKDIIRDVADKILEAKGMIRIRERVDRWKESFRVASNPLNIEQIYEKLKKCGCVRNYLTIRNWITSEDIIIPQSKDDLICIARATEDEVLMEILDSVYEEGSLIKKAHIRAGNILSSRLAESIAKKLIQDKLFDPYNVWDPIELNIEEVGLVKIYKIIDISQKWVTVNSFDTNRLMDEGKEI